MRTSGQNDAETAHWSGRLSLTIEDGPPHAFQAGFDLSGDARTGRLDLSGPLGATVARLDWAPGQARLQAEGRVREAASVDTLLRDATGAAVPVAALFDWLAGQPIPSEGWQPDLSRLTEGRLAARRTAPPPAVQLRVLLDLP